MASTLMPAFYLDCVDDYGTRKLVAHAVQLTDDGIRTPSYRWSDPASELTNLRVSAYLTPDQPRAWGYSCRYCDLVSIDLDHARAMARTLGRIQRDLARLRDQLGPPEDFHTYLLHIGSTLDIHHYLIRLAERGTDGKRYQHVAPLGVGEWLGQQEQRYAGFPAGPQPNGWGRGRPRSRGQRDLSGDLTSSRDGGDAVAAAVIRRSHPRHEGAGKHLTDHTPAPDSPGAAVDALAALSRAAYQARDSVTATGFDRPDTLLKPPR